MIKWFKRNDSLTTEEEIPSLVQELPESTGFFSKFKQRLSKTRQQLGQSLGNLLLGKKEIDKELLEELSDQLISADIGLVTTNEILNQIKNGLQRKELADGVAVYQALCKHLEKILLTYEKPLNLDQHSPFVILMVGINGAGKTTTIGKLAMKFQQMGKKVMLAAGDTFRAAAVEQLQEWGERNNIHVIAQQTGSDSASVIFDAMQSAKSKGIDVLIADTAGRLHTQHNLMDELKKIKRVLQKLDASAPHETMLVLDASIGQNALNQAKQFHQEIGITGITMTKLDGTAKGGILFAIVNELHIPLRYIGIGEGIDDLQPFSATEFVKACLQTSNNMESGS